MVASSSDSGPLDVPVDSNDDIVCTITNTRNGGQLEVVKDLDPDDDPGLFDLQIDGVTEYTDASGGDTTGQKDRRPRYPHRGRGRRYGHQSGDYDSSIECKDQAERAPWSPAPPIPDPLDVPVDSNDDIVCTITNTRRPGELEVVKDLDPDDDPGLFDLQIDGVTEYADASDADTTGKKTVDPGTHAVGEIAGTGTSLGDYDSSIECKDRGGTGTVVASSSGSGPLDVPVDSNDDIVCTITNTRRPGELEVVKDLDPDDDPGLFDLQIDGVTEKADATDADTTGKKSVDPDTHTVGEVAGTDTSLADYDSTIECKDQGGAGTVVASSSDSGPLDVTVDSNDDIVCTITNTRRPGELEVVKDLVPSDNPGLFDLQIDGVTEKADAADADTTGKKSVDPDTHTVGEVAGTDSSLDDYDSSIECKDQGGFGAVVASSSDSGPLDVPVDSNDDIVCTITNTRQQGSIELTKEWIGTPGSTTLKIGTAAGDSDVDTELVDGGDGTTGANSVDTGTYYVSETDPGPYDTSLVCTKNGAPYTPGASDSVVVGKDDVVVCTYTNTRQTGQLEVVKLLQPEDDLGLFNLQIDGVTDPDAANVGNGGSTGKETVDAGDYAVGEIAGTLTTLDDYTISISCVDQGGAGTEVASGEGAGPLDVTVNANDDIVCTVTNKSIYGKIIVEKQTDPDGAPDQFNFAGTAAGTIGDGGQIIVDRLLPGPYTSTETLPGAACTGEPIPTVEYLGTGAALKQGQRYVVKAPRFEIESVFDAITWLEFIGESHYWGAMVQPDQNMTWGYQAWEVVSDWRDPFTMNSLISSPIDVHSLGVFEADVLITAQILDHQDYVYAGVKRHAKFYLLADGQKEELGQVEIADPARITVKVPRRGEVIIETHDTTIWWTTCESLDWKLISIECDDENSTGNVPGKTANFELEAAETVKCTFTNRKESAILVEKQTEPDAEPTRFTFSGDVAGDVADGAQLFQTKLEPGSYTATETVPSAWKLMDIACDDGNSNGNVGAKTADFQVEAGEIVKCTFENKKLAATLEAVASVEDRTDDAEERVSNGAVNRGSGDLELTEDGSNLQVVGLRFPHLQVPLGAPIVAAYIEFTADEKGSDQTDLLFHGQATDNALHFESDDGDISSRPKTAASVAWPNVPAWTQVGATYDTPDLSAVIQEIVNRPGWSQGNALVIMVSGTGRRTAEAWDGDPDGAARLHVVYSQTGGCFSLATTASPEGSGQVAAAPPPNCQGGRYAEDTDVTLTALPGSDAGFSHWSGDASGTNSTTTITIDGPKSVTANFDTYGPLTYDSHTVDDDNSGSSSGNGDGALDCGETIELSVPVGNHGTAQATGVSALLSTADPYVSCSAVNSTYPDIPGSGTAANDTAYVCTANAITPDGHSATFALDLTAAMGGPWSDSFDLTVTCAGAGSVHAPVSQASDDAEERAGGSLALKSQDLELVEDRDTQTVGLRFQDITVPQGATITEAYVTFYADETHSGETHLTFHGQAADNAATFEDVNGDITDRTATAASVDWNNVPPWATVHAAYDTPNLAPIVQEIVNRSSWASGNSLALIISGSGKRVAESYDGAKAHDDLGLAPRLHIAYGPPGDCYTLTTSTDPTAGGTVNASPGPNCAGGKYIQGTSVQLTAQAAAGYAFDHWSDALSGGTNPDIVVMDAAKAVTAHFVTSNIGPLAYQSHTVDDDATAPSNGNGDNVVDCGETIEISVEVLNQGADAATGVNGTLSSSDANLACAASSSAYPDIPGSGSAANASAFVCTVGGSTPDGHTITVDLDLTAAAGGPWSDSFDIQVTCEGGPPIMLEAKVSQPSDDAEERDNTTLALKSNDLEIVEDRGLQTIGLRFQNIAIPKGATITEASITFYADQVGSVDTNLTFHGQNTGNASTFVDDDGNITDRARTAALVNWNSVPSWNTEGQAYDTPNLASIIQEIVNHGDWSSGNALVIIIDGSGKRVATSYDGDEALAPELHVTFSGTP